MNRSAGDRAASDAGADTDTYPVWTVRYTWAVLDSDDRPTHTYAAAMSETEAIDRAVFTLDRYDNSGERLLVVAHVKRPNGWSEVLRPNAACHEYLYAFQRFPARP